MHGRHGLPTDSGQIRDIKLAIRSCRFALGNHCESVRTGTILIGRGLIGHVPNGEVGTMWWKIAIDRDDAVLMIAALVSAAAISLALF